MTSPSRSNDGSLALVSCLSGGYRCPSVLQCVGLVVLVIQTLTTGVESECMMYIHFQIDCRLNWDLAFVRGVGWGGGGGGVGGGGGGGGGGVKGSHVHILVILT